MRKILIVLVLFLTGCVGIPENVKPVDDFRLEKYLGKWYEIARLDHSFERGLSRVTAEYSLRDDGGVRVLNRGYSEKEEDWKEAEGKAYFVQRPDQGYFKVSFFGPFYGSYIVFELDQENYQYSLVSGPNKSYLWILARAPEIKEDLRNAAHSKSSSTRLRYKQIDICRALDAKRDFLTATTPRSAKVIRVQNGIPRMNATAPRRCPDVWAGVIAVTLVAITAFPDVALWVPQHFLE